VLMMAIEEAEETIERVVVGEQSSLVGMSLKAARIPEKTGMWVIVLRRGERWVRPHPRTVIQAGDVIIASGYAEGEEDFRRLASP